jgi:hypothetical protein
MPPEKKPSAWHSAYSTKTPVSNGNLQWLNQIAAREADVARLEMALLMALLPTWGARRVLDAMGEK